MLRSQDPMQWHTSGGDPLAGFLARRVAALTLALNESMKTCNATWLRICSDQELKISGRYDPSIGQGVEEETDAGNFSGSILLLAMLTPEICGLQGAPTLNVFGTPLPHGLCILADGPPRSGRGPDNRRTNVIESILNEWQDREEYQDVRTQLLETWTLVRVATSVLCWRREWKWPYVVQHHLAEVMGCDRNLLPEQLVYDQHFQAFEKVSTCVTQAAALKLAGIPRGFATNAQIADSVGLGRKSSCVGLIKTAIWRCEAANVEHGGNLLKLFCSPRPSEPASTLLPPSHQLPPEDTFAAAGKATAEKAAASIGASSCLGLPTSNEWIALLCAIGVQLCWPMSSSSSGRDDPAQRLRELSSGEDYEVDLRDARSQQEGKDTLFHGTLERNLPNILWEHYRTGHGLKATCGAGGVQGVYSSDLEQTARRYPMGTWEGQQQHGEKVTSDQRSPRLVLLELRAYKSEAIWKKKDGTNRQWAHKPEKVEIVRIIWRGMRESSTLPRSPAVQPPIRQALPAEWKSHCPEEQPVHEYRHRSSPCVTGQHLPATLPPMDWGPNGGACLTILVQQWQQRIQSCDPEWFARARHNIFAYLILKVSQVINEKNWHEKNWPGQAGCAFLSTTEVTQGLVWSAGGKEQATPLQILTVKEYWRPVIMVRLQPQVSEAEYNPHDFLAVFCPDTALQGRRPLVVHKSRVRRWVDASDATVSSGSADVLSGVADRHIDISQAIHHVATEPSGSAGSSGSSVSSGGFSSGSSDTSAGSGSESPVSVSDPWPENGSPVHTYDLNAMD